MGPVRICFCRQRACGRPSPLHLPGASLTLHQPPPGRGAAWRGGSRAKRSLSFRRSPRAGCPSPHSFLSCREVNVRHRPKQPLLELLPREVLILAVSERQVLASDLSGRKVNQMRSIRFCLWAPRGPAGEREGPSKGPVRWLDGGRRPEAARR